MDAKFTVDHCNSYTIFMKNNIEDKNITAITCIKKTFSESSVDSRIQCSFNLAQHF